MHIASYIIMISDMYITGYIYVRVYVCMCVFVWMCVSEWVCGVSVCVCVCVQLKPHVSVVKFELCSYSLHVTIYLPS